MTDDEIDKKLTLFSEFLGIPENSFEDFITEDRIEYIEDGKICLERIKNHFNNEDKLVNKENG